MGPATRVIHAPVTPPPLRTHEGLDDVMGHHTPMNLYALPVTSWEGQPRDGLECGRRGRKGVAVAPSMREREGRYETDA